MVACGVVSAVAQVSPADSDKPSQITLRESTRRILNANDLTKTAKQDPVAAIVALDRLRDASSESAEDISLAIAEVALRGADSGSSVAKAGLFLGAASETYAAALEQAAVRGGIEMSEGGSLTALGIQLKAVEGLVGALQEIPLDSSIQTISNLPGPLGVFDLNWEVEAEDWTPSTHRYIAASTLERRKKDIEGKRSGLGAPVVAIRKGDLPDAPDFEGSIFPVYKYYYPLTAVLSFSAEVANAPRQASLRLVDPRRVKTIELDDMKYPLAIDFGSQIVALTQETDTHFGISGARNPGRYMALMGLYALSPPRTDKIPLVLVHGLKSSQNTWNEVYDELVVQPDLRDRYQAWAFSYPTGLPFSYSASFLRQALTETIQDLDPEGTNPLLNRTVLVGHSMGGLLVRMQVTDSGMVLWDSIFSKSPDEVDLDPEDLEIVRSTLVFEPLPFVSRSVFFSVPHRGSKQASNMLGKFGATLVSLPEELKELSARVTQSEQELLVGRSAERGKMPDSVQALQPDYPLILALDQIPIDSAVTYHTVVGDKGQGDTPDSSDGFVPYWSSHLDGAASERIVPSGHSTHQHPEGIEELERILYLHLDSVDSSE